MIALVLGTVLALASLAYVLAPLFMEAKPAPAQRVVPERDGAGTAANAVATLREIEFDRATGKLSNDDYALLKVRYTGFAVEAMRAEAAGAGNVVEGAEAAAPGESGSSLASVARCDVCGPRPEGDAIYCSSCGRFLGDPCAQCGAVLDQPGARFCAGCGHAVAA